MLITQEYLKRLFHYDPKTGVFTRIMKTSNRVKIGQISGSVSECRSGNRYLQIRIMKRLYSAHRLAWLYVYGQFPTELIDHINGDGTDNRLCNLRSATREENNRNAKIHITNKSGVSGVHWSEQRKKWCAEISVSNKGLKLGRFNNFFDAVCARKSAEKILGYHPNHGSFRVRGIGGSGSSV